MMTPQTAIDTIILAMDTILPPWRELLGMILISALVLMIVTVLMLGPQRDYRP